MTDDPAASGGLEHLRVAPPGSPRDGTFWPEKALSDWEAMLGEAVAPAVREYVEEFLRTQWRLAEQGAGPQEVAVSAGEAPEEYRDAVVAFAMFFQQVARPVFAARRDARPSAPGGVRASASPPTGPVSASAGEQARDSLARTVRGLSDPAFDDLRAAIVADSDQSEDAWTLLALLQVYFGIDWRGANDFLLELAFRAGEIICRIARRQTRTDAARIHSLGCQLLNGSEQFRRQFECRALPVRCGFDSQYCEAPEGRRGGGNTVAPLSFYVVTGRTGQACRRARVQWA
jgi:hypothetical protein